MMTDAQLEEAVFAAGGLREAVRGGLRPEAVAPDSLFRAALEKACEADRLLDEAQELFADACWVTGA